MRSRALILASLVVLAAVILVIGVAVAGAGQSNPLPQISAPDLLAKMAQAEDVAAVSGDIAWHNELFGDLSDATNMAHVPAQSPLTTSGSGRIWLGDAGTRIESQGSGGDQVVVVNKAERTAWIYDSTKNTVKKIVVTGSAPAETPSPAPSALPVTPDAISAFLQQVARFATVEVAGQTAVAGRDAYQLRMTPVAEDTALGYVQAAIDGQTMLPLQLDVYAKGATSPVLRFGFTSISYDSIDAATFTFTPPEGAKVMTRTIDGNEVHGELQRAEREHSGKQPTDAQKDKIHRLLQQLFLTRGQVAKLVPYDLAYARDYAARPFRTGFVLGQDGPLISGGAPLLQAIGAISGMDLRPDENLRPGKAFIPGGKKGVAAANSSSVLVYGDGFGTILLWQTKATPQIEEELQQLQRASQVFGTTTVNGAKATEVGTPLGGAIVWQKGDTALVAAGMVPMSDLEAFTSVVR